jgi:hypothetical protein
MRYRNYCRFYRKHQGSPAQMVTVKAIMGLGALLRAGLWLVRSSRGHPNATAMVKGYLQVIREVPTY